MRGRVSVHELATANKHATAMTVHAASTDVINAFARLDLPALWGDGSRAAADGTQLDTWSDNLLARDLDPVRGVRRDRVPAHRRFLHRAVLALRLPP